MWVKCTLQSVILCEFTLFFVVAILVFVSVGNRLSIKNVYVAIPVGTITCVQAVGAGVGLSCLSTISLSSFSNLVNFFIEIPEAINVGR